MSEKYKHPATLAFTRSVEPSIFVFSATSCSDDKQPREKKPVLVTLETIRGTISNFIKATDFDNYMQKDGKSEKNPRNTNIQDVEKAVLPSGCDTLVVEGYISFLANTATPCISNDPNFMKTYKPYHDKFSNLSGWKVLAERYIMNMVNGRWLWRNRTQVAQAEKGSLKITLRYKPYKPLDVEEAIQIEIDALAIEANECLHFTAIKDLEKRKSLEKLCDCIAEALGEKSDEAWKKGLRVNLRAEAVLGEGAIVYPSQEFATNKDKGSTGREISKILAKRRINQHEDQAILHEQKVGNAIRTIDTWYDEKIGDARAIAAEPYGVVTTESTVYRDGVKAKYFYKLIEKLDKELDRLKENNTLTADDYFFMSIIARGGVLGGKKDEKSKKKDKNTQEGEE